ncbi:metallophosphoesterase [bacterium]|nr:metallophosphoesterase [bacterium]
MVVLTKKSYFIALILFVSSILAGINYGPYLTCPSTSGATIQFGKDIWDSANIEWDDSAAYWSDGTLDNGVDISEIDIRASYNISGYSAGTRVYYRITAGDDVSPVYSFRTMARPGSPIRFCIYGDCRTNESVHTVVCERMVETNPSLVIHTGDLGDAAWSVGDWDAYFRATDTLAARVPYVSTIGNHEIPYDIYKYLFDLPNNEEWYAIHAGCISILNINVYNNFAEGSEQYNWIEATLADSIPSTTRWIIVNEHESPYSTSNHGSNILVRSILKPLYDLYGVAVVTAGHDHCYEHSYVDGIHYFVAGGGGAPLYSVSGGEFTIQCASSYNYIEAYADNVDLCFVVRSEADAFIEEFCLSDFIVGIDDALNPSGLTVGASPNPFNSSVKIDLGIGFNINESPAVDIYSISGKKVWSCSKSDRDGIIGRLTRQTIEWDGMDNNGKELPVGCYLVSVTASGSLTTKRIFLLK